MAINSFFDPSSTYGAEDWWNNAFPDWENSQIWNIAASNDPQGSWQRKLTDLGYGGVSDKDQFAQSLYNKARSGWGAAKLTNPELDWWKYLKTLGIGDLVAQASPSQKGINAPNYAPPSRWGMRPY